MVERREKGGEQRADKHSPGKRHNKKTTTPVDGRGEGDGTNTICQTTVTMLLDDNDDEDDDADTDNTMMTIPMTIAKNSSYRTHEAMTPIFCTPFLPFSKPPSNKKPILCVKSASILRIKACPHISQSPQLFTRPS